ncbi:hypothetical protein Tco_0374532 [Tanacetum coccineum]
MGTIDSIKSVLTPSALDALCERFHISDVVHPELPGRNDRILNSPAGKIGVYSRFFNFSNYRVPLSQFLVDVLDYFQINLSQLSVIATAKVSHFEILCRVHGFVPTVDSAVFPLNIPLHHSKSLRTDPHPTPAEFNVDVCNFLADNLASFRKLPEPFLCFIGISRYYDLEENCYPTFWDDEDQEMDLFAFIRHADPMKVKIGEREAREGEVPLLELTKKRVVPLVVVNVQGNQESVIQEKNADAVNEDDVDAAAAGHSGEGGHVIRPRNLEKGKLSMVLVVLAIPPKKLREDHGAFGNIGASIGGKSLAAIQELFEQSTLNVDVGVTTAATIPFVTSSVTSTPECEGGDYMDFVTGPNMRTQKLAKRFVISSDSAHDSNANAADDEVTSVVRSSVLDPAVLTTAVATTVVVDASAPTSGAGHELGAGQRPRREAFMFRKTWILQLSGRYMFPNGMLLMIPLLMIRRSVETCFNDEIRMRLEHELRGRQKLEERCTLQVNRLKERDANIASLKAQISLKEAEAAEAIRLCGQITNVEAAKAAKDGELNSLRERNTVLESATIAKDYEIAKLSQELSSMQLSCDDLSIKASTLECEKDKLANQMSVLEADCSGHRDEVLGYKLFKERIEEIQDAQIKALSDCVACKDSDLLEMALHMDKEFYPRFLKTIARRRWILSRGVKLAVVKCLHSPEYMAALGGAIGHAIDKGMQDGLVAGIENGKARRNPDVISIYNPSAEDNYVAAINALRTVDFPLLAKLESLKDASMMDVMDLLRLEGPAAEAPETSQLQPSLEQLMVPIHQLEDQAIISETSLSFSLEPMSTKSLVVKQALSRFRLPLLLYQLLSVKSSPFPQHHLLMLSSLPRLFLSKRNWIPRWSTLQLLKLVTFYVRGRMFPLRSLSLYAPLPNASVTSYGPSHLGLRLPPSFAWLALLFR